MMKCLLLFFLLFWSSTEGSSSKFNLLVRPCLNDLVANLIGQEDAEGHILYQARETFELSPRQLKAVLAKVQHQLLLHQRKGHEGGKSRVASEENSRPSEAQNESWTFFNTLGNWLFGRHFSIKEQKLHQSPIEARMPEEPEELFCPGLTKAVLNQIKKPNEIIMEHDDRFKIASQTIEISLMTLFMHHYGWTQMSKGRSWNPLKTMKSTQKGLRMIYDSYMEAIMRRRNSCIQWILFGLQC